MKKIGSITKVFDVLSGLSPQHILILPHVRADADALGSCYGFAKFLEQQGHQIRIVLDEKPSSDTEFIIADYPLDIYSKELIEQLPEVDLIVFLDHHEIARLNQRAGILDEYPTANILIIDHHQAKERTEKEYIANFDQPQRVLTTWLESDRSSVSEMIAELFLAPTNIAFNPDTKFALTNKTASALLAGLYGDTGGLRYSNTSKRTFEICAYLMDSDIDISWISEQLFGNKSLQQLKLTGEIFSNAKLNQVQNMIWYTVKSDFLAKYKVTQDALEGVCSQMREVENIDLAILIREVSDSEIRVNLRSNHAIDVNKLAQEFGGGGHARAAGITYNGNDLQRFEIELINKAELMLNGKSNRI